MTIYTRPSRIAKRNAYLLATHGDNPEALIEALQNHAVLEPFDHRTASFEEMKRRYEIIASLSLSVSCDFNDEDREFFPRVGGEPVGFLPQENNVEVILRRNTAKPKWNYGKWEYPEPSWTYRSILIPAELFRGEVGKITSWYRTTTKTQRDDANRKAILAQEAERRRLEAERRKLDEDIIKAEQSIKAAQVKFEKLQASRAALAEAE